MQDTWVGVLQGIGRFEGCSSLKTWLFRILVNRAKRRAVQERRSIPFSTLWGPDAEPSRPALEMGRFRGPDHPQWPGHWTLPPRSRGASPEDQFLSQEAGRHTQLAIQALPPSQREVIILRDVEQRSSEEVCSVLAISETNQRVILHRARAKMRTVLEHYHAQG